MSVIQIIFRFYNAFHIRFLYKGIIINHNKKPSQPTLKRRFFKKKAAFFHLKIINLSDIQAANQLARQERDKPRDRGSER